MSHEFESGFFVRQPAWHRLGVLLTEAPHIEDATRLAGLDWHVHTAPLLTASGAVVDSHRAVLRGSDGKILGVVGAAYRPLQNAQAFQFFEPFLESGLCELEAAGSLKEGKRVWVLARVKSAEAEVTSGDTVPGYFLLSNAHDGTQADLPAIVHELTLLQSATFLNEEGVLLRVRSVPQEMRFEVEKAEED